MTQKYCAMCDKIGSTDADDCPVCGFELERVTPRRKLTRQEQLEGLADSGVDTWEDYRGER